MTEGVSEAESRHATLPGEGNVKKVVLEAKPRLATLPPGEREFGIGESNRKKNLRLGILEAEMLENAGELPAAEFLVSAPDQLG